MLWTCKIKPLKEKFKALKVEIEHEIVQFIVSFSSNKCESKEVEMVWLTTWQIEPQFLGSNVILH